LGLVAILKSFPCFHNIDISLKIIVNIKKHTNLKKNLTLGQIDALSLLLSCSKDVGIAIDIAYINRIKIAKVTCKHWKTDVCT
jgi:hypothetical protein